MARDHSLSPPLQPPAPRRRPRRPVAPGRPRLSVGRRCLVFQLIHSDTVPNLLRRFLADSRHTFVGMWIHSDFDKLLNSKHVLLMHRKPLDLRHHAVSNCTGRSLLREVIVEEFLGVKGVRFDEMIGRSEWDDQVLGSDQVMFAAADAYASFLIGIELKAWKL